MTKEPKWEPWLWLAEQYAYRAVWSFPLATSAGKVIGTLAMYFSEPREATPRDYEFATVLTRAAAIIISRHREAEERERAEAALRESEARLRALVEGIPQLAWRAVDGGVWTWASPQWVAYTGHPEPEGRDLGWLDAVHPEDRGEVAEAWRDAEARGTFRADHRLFHAGEGRHRWVQSQATPVRGADRIVEWLGTTTDVEDLRRLQEERILVAELQHRTRNLLTVVSGIAEQTLAASASLDEFGPRFDQRLAALGRVQGLLSRGAEPNVTADELVRLELAAHGVDPDDADRVRLGGPRVALPARVVQLLALALHELMTNALKHGALGRAQGRLDIAWREERGTSGEGTRLRLDWKESGVALGVDVSAVRRGFGLDLIEFALPYELDGETRLTLTPEGVRCTIDLPIDDATAALGAAGP
ncbi:MAG: PAS domain-containing protein [Solirubrobacterales bacterium]|nr:PAS domain-containing protein [Solirubrobacterales bacterium]